MTTTSFGTFLPWYSTCLYSASRRMASREYSGASRYSPSPGSTITVGYLQNAKHAKAVGRLAGPPSVVKTPVMALASFPEAHFTEFALRC